MSTGGERWQNGLRTGECGAEKARISGTVPWCSGLAYVPVKDEIAGSNPVGTAVRRHVMSFGEAHSMSVETQPRTEAPKPIDRAYMDTSVRPGDHFFQYAHR